MKRLLPLVLLLCLGVGCGSSHALDGEIVLRAVPQRGQLLTQAGTQLARGIVAKRLDKLGVSSSDVRTAQLGEVIADFTCTDAPANAAGVVSETGQLQFFDFEKDLAAPTVKNGNPTPYPTLYSLLATPPVVTSDGAPPGAYYLFDARAPHRVLQGPTGTIDDLLAPYGGKQPARTSIFTVPANREVVSGTPANFTASTRPVRQSPDGTYWYLFKLPPEISGDDLKRSDISAGSDPNTGVPQVTLGFTPHGAKEFQAITKAEYERGQLVAGLHHSAGQLNQVYAQHNAIVLDNRLRATPYIDYTDNALSLGIAGGSAVISNMGSSQAANDLALVLQSGSLPYRFELVSSKLCRR